MSCIDALPSEWRKHLKFTKKRNLAVESDEAQLWIDAKFIKISKLSQKAIYSELVPKSPAYPLHKNDPLYYIQIITLNGIRFIKYHLW